MLFRSAEWFLSVVSKCVHLYSLYFSYYFHNHPLFRGERQAIRAAKDIAGLLDGESLFTYCRYVLVNIDVTMQFSLSATVSECTERYLAHNIHCGTITLTLLICTHLVRINEQLERGKL